MEITITLEEAEELFETNVEELAETDEDSLEFIEQNHFGDLLIEKTENGNERYRLWRNLDCNEGGVEIEYSGAANKWTWQTIYKS